MTLIKHKFTKPDMLNGSISKSLIYFALPLLVGNIFQQLYNTVDSWVVGNYVSNAAFAAVGTNGPIMNLLIGCFMGLSSGAGVVISQYFGAGKKKEVSDAVHTCIALTLILGVVFTIVGVAITPTLIGFMKTPEDVVPESELYLTIYFSGIIGLLIYNMGSGILRAVGNSTLPFIALVISAVINIVFDLVFVLVFGMGVDGVAYATILAQGISAAFILIVLMLRKDEIKLDIKKICLNIKILLQIIKIGIPAALQLTITAFSNIFVQGYINYFGSICMNGWTAFTKIDAFIMLPMQSLSLAATTFVGQNLGNGNPFRARRGTRTSLIISMSVSALISVPIMIFAPSLVAFFNNDPAVVDYGTRFLRTLTPFYILCCINQVYAGSLRGAGNSRAPMIIMLSSFVAFRQLYLFVVKNFISNTITLVSMSYPAGWFACSIIMLIYYKNVKLEKTAIVTKDS